MNFGSETKGIPNLHNFFFIRYSCPGVWTVFTKASFGTSVRGLRWRAPVPKHQWILNCTTLTTALKKESWLYIDQISPRLLPWFLEFVLSSQMRIKYAETVPLCNNQTIPFSALIWNFPFIFIASQTYKGRVPELHTDHPTSSTVSVGQRVF